MTDHLLGFDVSHFQPALTPDGVGALIRRGYSFAGIKCSEGDYQTDPHFAQNRAALRTHAVPRWLYHEATAHNPVGRQVDRIMAATSGVLYPRERLVIVLGDFDVPPDLAQQLANVLEVSGPTKRSKGPGDTWVRTRPPVVMYANRSNWRSVYRNLTPPDRPKIVAAFPGDGTEFSIPGAVIHQFSNHDPATGGDADHWRNGSRGDLLDFFRTGAGDRP